MSADFEGWQPLIARLQQEHGLHPDETEWLLFDPRSRPLSTRRLADMARNLTARIDQAWVKNGGYEEVILIGHSLGGLLMRAAYVEGCGGDAGHRPRHAWAEWVTRIVLLATPNRGIDKMKHPQMRGGHRMMRRLPWRLFTYQDLLLGSVFITDLRINWIRLFAGEGSRPEVVLLLASRDRIVSREDSLDVLAFPGSVVAEVPDARHNDLVRLDLAPDPDGRYALIRSAILEPHRLPVDPVGGPVGTRAARHVVFILHGIRASRIDDWLRKVADQVRKKYGDGVEVVRPAYGFFSALKFAIPFVRRKNIRSFQDAYTQALARNPHADFDFIGHSNGTYMLGASLRDISSMSFRNVVLAGSVLPAGYPWDRMIGTQVERVRNERGRRDWPVGWLCSALHDGLSMKDVGTGGYSGFTKGLVEEEKLHPGGHGSMFNQGNIPRMVDFAFGESAGEELTTQTGELEWWSRISRLCPHLVRVLLILLAAAIGWALWAGSFWTLAWMAGVVWLLYVFLDVY